MKTLSALALVLIAGAAQAGGGLDTSWRFIGGWDTPYTDGQQCAVYSPRRERATDLVTVDGRTHVVAYSYDAGPASFDHVSVSCMKRRGYVLDKRIEHPWDNGAWVDDYKARTGIEVMSPEDRAAKDAAEAAEEAARLAEKQRKKDEAARAFAERDAKAQAAQSAYCASLTRAQLASDLGLRNCPRDKERKPY